MFKRLREGLFGPSEPEPQTPPEEQAPTPELAPKGRSEEATPAATQAAQQAQAIPAATAPSAAPAQRTTPAGSLRGPFAGSVAHPQSPVAAPSPVQFAAPAAPVSTPTTSAPVKPQTLTAPAPPAPAASAATAAPVAPIAPPSAPPAQGRPLAQPLVPAQPSVARPQPQPAQQATPPAIQPRQVAPASTAPDEAAAPATPIAPARPTAPAGPPAQAPGHQGTAPGKPHPSVPSQPAPATPAARPAQAQPPASPAAKPLAQSAPVTPPTRSEEEEEPELEEEGQRGLFRNPFKLSLGRTRALFGRVNSALEADEEISEDLWDELEETLITSDVGVQTTEKLLDTLRERVRAEGLTHGSQLRSALKEELAMMLGEYEPLVFSETSPISVYLVVGVNGVGKTTTIAKMANQLKRQKHRVLLAAGDTFRAAATEQLKTWGDRIGVGVVAHQNGADPGAVVFDAMQAAQARGSDVLIVDTAGRLHTKYNLMEELKKIVKVLQKYDPEAPHEVLLVIDATTGQNGFLQAKQFVQDAGVSGVLLTKLDGTARGGIVFAIAAELGLPIKYIGTGERVNDIAPFDPDAFVDALFDEE